MSSIPLQYVLLFAIAISQIFGGFSCCCLGRTLFGNAAVADGHAIRNFTGETIAVDAAIPIGKCPKCRAKESGRMAGKVTSTRHGKFFAVISEDGHCRCLKHAISANVSKESVTVDYEALAWFLSFLDSVPKRDVIVLEQRKFEVPVRFGGRSWQSIACVWKN